MTELKLIRWPETTCGLTKKQLAATNAAKTEYTVAKTQAAAW